MKFKKVEKGIYKAEDQNIWIVKGKRHGEWNAYRSEEQPTGWSAFDDALDFITFGDTKAEVIAEVQNG